MLRSKFPTEMASSRMQPINLLEGYIELSRGASWLHAIRIIRLTGLESWSPLIGSCGDHNATRNSTVLARMSQVDKATLDPGWWIAMGACNASMLRCRQAIGKRIRRAAWVELCHPAVPYTLLNKL